MNISKYLESTYLKTAKEANLSEQETIEVVIALINEAIECNFKFVMIRPQYIQLAKNIILEKRSSLLVGTVVDFPFGDGSTSRKMQEAKDALSKGADELDYVADYNAFKQGFS